MTKLRQLWLLTALGAVAVLAGGYFVMVSPQSAKAAALREETASQEQANASLRSQIAMLNKQMKDLPAQQAELAKFSAKIPNNPAQPAMLRSLSDAADNAGVELVSVSPAQPEFAKGVNPDTGVELAGKVDAPNGQVLVTIPLAIVVEGKYSQLSQFFSEIESLNRAMLVAGFTVSPMKDKSNGPAGTASATSQGMLTATLSADVLMTTKAPAAAVKVAPPADPDATVK